MKLTSAVAYLSSWCYEIRYDTIEEFNVDSRAEPDRLNLAQVAR